MKTKQITQLHERAALILERITDMESIIEIHNHNLQMYNGWFGDTLTKSETRKIERREIAISRLWKLYDKAIQDIQLNLFRNHKKTA
jgi:hypothetical protein